MPRGAQTNVRLDWRVDEDVHRYESLAEMGGIPNRKGIDMIS